MKYHQFLVGVALLAALPGCTANVEEESELASMEQPFKGFRNTPNYLMHRIATGDVITVCLRGPAINSNNFNERKARIANAMFKWASAARNAAVSPPPFSIGNIFIHNDSTCRQRPDVEITWYNSIDDTPNRRNEVNDPNGFFEVWLGGNLSDHVILHEMGHVFGLHDTYWAGHEGCLPGQATSVMCGNSVPGGAGFTDLRPDDINGVQEIYCVANPSPSQCKRRAEFNTSICSLAGDRLHVGKFNGDSRADLLCHNVNNGKVWVVYSNSEGKFGSSAWVREMGFCTGSNNELHIGDFNGDGRDDMLCHHKTIGTKTIAWASSSGQFSETNVTTTNPGWCIHAAGKLHVGDFDGDGKDDILCHDTSTGFFWIDYRHNGLNGTDWSKALNWCSHAAGKLHVGDFNGDGRDDVLCQDTGNGFIWIDYATGGTFGGTDSTFDGGFCFGSNGQLFIADFNNDGREDLLCHNPGSGYKKIALATNSSTNRFVGTSREWQMLWCYGGSRYQFHTADFNGNGASDFLCNDTQTGFKWQAFHMP